MSASEFWVYKGEWDVVFDGLALVNLGEESAEVLGTAFDATGASIAETVISAELSPLAKQLAVFSAHFPEEAEIIRITSTQPSTAVFLRDTLPGFLPGFLYETVPVIK